LSLVRKRLEGLVFGLFLGRVSIGFVLVNRLGRCFYGGVIDKFSFLLLFLTLWLILVLIFLGRKYKILRFSFSKYILNIIVLAVLLILRFISKTLFWFYIFFEVSLIPLLFLIVGWGYQVERIQASFYLLLYTIIGSLPLLVVLFFLLKNISLVWLVRGFTKGARIELITTLSFVIIFRILIKLPLYGFHL
jgi:NADH-ubiquinone oxidoreductase chain 4